MLILDTDELNVESWVVWRSEAIRSCRITGLLNFFNRYAAGIPYANMKWALRINGLAEVIRHAVADFSKGVQEPVQFAAEHHVIKDRNGGLNLENLAVCHCHNLRT